MALKADDPALCQGTSFMPPPLACNRDEPLVACCPVCLALLDGKSMRACPPDRMDTPMTWTSSSAAALAISAGVSRIPW